MPKLPGIPLAVAPCALGGILEKSVDYTQELLRNGFASYNEVIATKQIAGKS
jgi:hypothetical protein